MKTNTHLTDPETNSNSASTKPGRIHIDFMKCIGPLRHEPLGKVFFTHDDIVGMVPIGASALKPGNRKNSSQKAPYLKSCQIEGEGALANQLEIQCCPPKVLQGHNFFGHSVLIDYVSDVFNMLTEEHGMCVSDADRASWEKGHVQLYEAHITGHFPCFGDPDAVFDYLDRKFRVKKNRRSTRWITLGGSEIRRSTHHMLTIYCKSTQMKTQWKKPGVFQRQLLDWAAGTIRVEIKLYRAGLVGRGLGTVANWRKVDVDKLFFELLGKYRLPEAVHKQVPSHAAEALLTKAEFRAYTAWLSNQDLKGQYSRSTLHSLRKSILAKLGVDISLVPVDDADGMENERKIFVPENLLALPENKKLLDAFYHRPLREWVKNLGCISEIAES